MNRWIVLAICLSLGIAYIIWDIFLATDGVGGNTISEIVKYVSYFAPSLAVLFGYLFGHLFMNRPIKAIPYFKFSTSMIILGVLILIAFIISMFVIIQPWIYFVISFPLGGIFWTQRRENTGKGWLLQLLKK